MFAVEHVIQVFPLLEEIEKDRPVFTQEEKQVLYRIAFHKESFGEVQKLIAQASAPQLKEEDRKQLLDYHAGKLQKPPNGTAAQIEDYIFQTQLMVYEKEKANRMLEDILKRSGLDQELDSMIEEVRKNPFRLQKEKEAGQNGKSL